jgi:hypothetical protein
VFYYCDFSFLLAPDTNPMELQYDSVRYTMTVEEVEAIFGRPGGGTDESRTWAGPRWGVILVEFKDRRVIRKHFFPIHRSRAPRFADG